MKILHIISSAKGDASFSLKLGNAVVEKLEAKYPGSTVTTRDVVKHPFPHLEEVHLSSFFTPAENHSPEQAAAIKHSNIAIAELQDADAIVVDVPFYNFSIPSALKAWIDHICRAGVTFHYTANGPEGLVKGKKVYFAIASGGVYSEGPYAPYDFATPYLKGVFGFLGMTNTTILRAEGLSVPDKQEAALAKAIESIEV
ncbi:FMN-dependent NADH-azoreductase [Mucilaginibacter sp.]